MSVFFRLLPAADRDAIAGDLLEDADFRGIAGARRTAWLAAACGAIAFGLSMARLRSWFVAAPVHEVVSGLAIDGRGLLRDGPTRTLLRAIVFAASVATLALAAEVLVRTLMAAAGL